MSGTAARVEVVAVATPAPISRLAAEQRFLAARDPRAARWTPPDAHETALIASPGVLDALETSPAVARIQVHSRDHVLYENTRNPGGGWTASAGAGSALKGEQSRNLTVAEARAWLGRYREVFTLARNRLGYLSLTTIPAYRRLQTDAETVFRFAGRVSDADRDRLRREHKVRQLALNSIDGVPHLRGKRKPASTQSVYHRDPPGHDPLGLGL